ncbi:MAG: hypothetical protein ABR975_07500 [Vulcanimicrobiaceae bacterium]
MRAYATFIPVAIVFALAGCGGGGAHLAPAAPSVSPTPGSGTPGATSVRFRITVPAKSVAAKHRKVAYVSSATQSVVITLLSVDGTPYTGGTVAANLTPTSPNCSGTPLTCTVTGPLGVGTDQYLVATYDAPQTSTSPTAPAGNALSRATTTVAITEGVANTVPLTLDGVVDHATVAFSPAAVGAFATTQATIDAYDADSQLIVGPGSYVDANGNAVVLALSNPGNLSYSSNSFTAPSTAVTVTYTGGVPGSNLTETITPSAVSGSPNGALTGATLTIAAPPSLTSLAQSVWVPSTTALQETFTGTNFAPGASVTSSASGVTVTNVTVVNATTITANVNVAPGTTPGGLTLAVETPGGTTGTQPFTVVAGSVVSLDTDAAPTTGGQSGDLRYAIANAHPSDTLFFACGSPCTIDLAAALPAITQNLTIDGSTFGNVIIDGQSTYHAFFVDTGTVTLANLQIQNAVAQGGNGGNGGSVSGSNGGGAGGGGGGLGAGGGVFVNQNSADVTLQNVYFVNCQAVGGNGGTSAAGTNPSSGGGGGGLYFAGGNGLGGGGGGGGGVLGAGASTATSSGQGAAGGAGDGGGGGTGGAAGVTFTTNTAGSVGTRSGGNGGFGGGGGGDESSDESGTGVGAGGFGAGGGGASFYDQGGNGGPGGGGGGGGFYRLGGGTISSYGGSGGPLVGGVHGGAGGQQGEEVTGTAGGGGAAAGPAVFVFAGTLTTTNSGATGASATAGAAGSGTSGLAGTADSTPVFNDEGTVNGSTTAGPVASALGSSEPAARLRKR